MSSAKNVLGGDLIACCVSPMTGFYRDGVCSTGYDDLGLHIVCAEMTPAFLRFSLEKGNDLVTPVEEMEFPGLQPGDKWCLCVTRWKEALDAGVAPRVLLKATHISALEHVNLSDLKAHAIDG